MNLSNLPTVSVLDFWIPDDVRWLFYIVMALYIAIIIWHARRHHDGW